MTLTPGSEIQAGIDQVVAQGGGVVCLTAGTWTLSKTLTVGSNLKLTGAGPGTLIQGPEVVYNWPLIGVPKGPTPHDVTVSNLVIDGRIPKSVAFDPNNGYFDSLGMYFHDAHGTGKNLTIKGVEVRNTSEGLHAKGFDGVTVSDSYFHDNGVMLNPGLGNHNVYLLRDSNATISNVRAIDSWAGDGLHLRKMYGPTTLRNSTFVGNYRRGVHVQLSGLTASDIVIENNDFSYNGSSEIYLPDYNGTNMAGLDIETITGGLTGNTAVGNAGEGILCRFGTGLITGNFTDGLFTSRARGMKAEKNFLHGPFPDGQYRVVLPSGGVLTTLGAVPGSAITTQPYAGTPSQLWMFTNLGKSEYTVTAVASNLVLATTRSSDGAPVVVTTATGGADQVWRPVSAADGRFRLCSKSAPGVCLNGKESTASITAYGNTPSEQWSVTPD